MFDVWSSISRLKLDKEVCSILMVLILMNPDRHFPNSLKHDMDTINNIREQYVEALRVYLEMKYPKNSGIIFGHSINILSKLRDITVSSLSLQLNQLRKMGK